VKDVSLEALVRREDDHMSFHMPVYMLHLMVHTMPSGPAARVISVSKRGARPATTEIPTHAISPVHKTLNPMKMSKPTEHVQCDDPDKYDSACTSVAQVCNADELTVRKY